MKIKTQPQFTLHIEQTPHPGQLIAYVQTEATGKRTEWFLGPTAEVRRYVKKVRRRWRADYGEDLDEIVGQELLGS